MASGGEGPEDRLAGVRQREEAAGILLRKAQQLRLKGTVKGVHRLERKIMAEKAFLQSILSGHTALHDNHLCSSNLLHFEAVLHITDHATAVTAIEQSFCLIPAVGQTPVSVVVDVVADGGASWVRVFARKRSALHRKWLGDGHFGDKSVTDIAEDYIEASQQNPYKFQSPRVTFVFFDGITESIARDLRCSGILVAGPVYSDDSTETAPSPLEVVSMFREGGQNAPSQPSTPITVPPVDMPVCDRVNLDVSTMLAWVSALTHGGADCTFDDAIINEQAAQERDNPLWPQLQQATQGKRLMACRTAVENFNAIVETVGGPEEKRRSSALLERVEVVEDCPSERAIALKCSGRIKERAKVVFGSGDTLHATTLTANDGFVRAASHQGVCFDVYVHPSRALTEAKQKHTTLTT